MRPQTILVLGAIFTLCYIALKADKPNLEKDGIAQQEREFGTSEVSPSNEQTQAQEKSKENSLGEILNRLFSKRPKQTAQDDTSHDRNTKREQTARPQPQWQTPPPRVNPTPLIEVKRDYLGTRDLLDEVYREIMNSPLWSNDSKVRQLSRNVAGLKNRWSKWDGQQTTLDSLCEQARGFRKTFRKIQEEAQNSQPASYAPPPRY